MKALTKIITALSFVFFVFSLSEKALAQFEPQFGGTVDSLIYCDCNDVWWLIVGDPHGGDYIKNNQTRPYDCEPLIAGEWILGMSLNQIEVCEVTCGEFCCVIGSGYIIEFYGTDNCPEGYHNWPDGTGGGGSNYSTGNESSGGNDGSGNGGGSSGGSGGDGGSGEIGYNRSSTTISEEGSYYSSNTESNNANNSGGTGGDASSDNSSGGGTDDDLSDNNNNGDNSNTIEGNSGTNNSNTGNENESGNNNGNTINNERSLSENERSIVGTVARGLAVVVAGAAGLLIAMLIKIKFFT